MLNGYFCLGLQTLGKPCESKGTGPPSKQNFWERWGLGTQGTGLEIPLPLRNKKFPEARS